MNTTPPTTETDPTLLSLGELLPIDESGGRDAPAAKANGGADADDGTSPRDPRRRSFYAGAWRRLPRDLGYLIPTAALFGTFYYALPTAAYPYLVAHPWTLSRPTMAVALFAALFAAWAFGAVERKRIGWAEPRPIHPVDWTPRWTRNRAMRVLSAVADRHHWLHLLHALVVYPLVSMVTLGAGALLAVGFVLPVLGTMAVLERGDRVDAYIVDVGLTPPSTWIPVIVLGAVTMLLSIVLLPLWARGATLAHFWIDHLLLGGFRPDVLPRRALGPMTPRGGAVPVESRTRQRIERALHDGPR
ncbi:hypothetical protein JOE38_002146 [Clavibacter michiganensis]|uniref:hypothetical protein n=1 Tax=Clavibacter michiganensis TaxID=28447 RepID=UPI0019577A5F|nr:hypothetical protein [Clavibacter michiganensis]MBM7412323.1 hypothetical protein [Clavibacter michiganensis]